MKSFCLFARTIEPAGQSSDYLVRFPIISGPTGKWLSRLDGVSPAVTTGTGSITSLSGDSLMPRRNFKRGATI
jgi:hypothetical protein